MIQLQESERTFVRVRGGSGSLEELQRGRGLPTTARPLNKERGEWLVS